MPLKIVLPDVANPFDCKYWMVVFELPEGILPAVTAPVPLFTAAVEKLPNVFVFGEASGADADNRPAMNLNISDTFVVGVKLLKYEPFKLVCHALEVGLPLLILYEFMDCDTVIILAVT
jgi:hypothetical protein